MFIQRPRIFRKHQIFCHPNYQTSVVLIFFGKFLISVCSPIPRREGFLPAAAAANVYGEVNWPRAVFQLIMVDQNMCRPCTIYTKNTSHIITYQRLSKYITSCRSLFFMSFPCMFLFFLYFSPSIRWDFSTSKPWGFSKVLSAKAYFEPRPRSTPLLQRALFPSETDGGAKLLVHVSPKSYGAEDVLMFYGFVLVLQVLYTFILPNTLLWVGDIS